MVMPRHFTTTFSRAQQHSFFSEPSGAIYLLACYKHAQLWFPAFEYDSFQVKMPALKCISMVAFLTEMAIEISLRVASPRAQ